MLNINYKKEAINYLNKLFSNYDQLSDISEFSGNDPEMVVAIISKIIKYAFLNPGYDARFSVQRFIKRLPNIDFEYKELCMKKKGKKLFKKVTFTPFYPLDEDLDLYDLTGLHLPDKNYIVEICQNNIERNNEHMQRAGARERKLNELMGFKIAAFTYETEDIVYLDEKFCYDGLNLTGDVISDYRTMYADERYQTNNPCYKPYNANLQAILASSDMRLIKKGSLYFINNGRHRILYLLARGNAIAISAQVNKRIENEEFNKILLDLRERINFEVFKDNPYTSDDVICLIYKGMLYKISGIEDLRYFASSYDNYVPLMSYRSHGLNREVINDWMRRINEYCSTYGINILENSFTDLVTDMGVYASACLYQAYLAVCAEQNHQIIKEKLYQIDSEELKR